MGVAEVSNVLWREREQLDLLLFKLEEEQLVLNSGRTRWVAHATREVEIVLEQVRQSELLRAVEVDAYAESVGLGPNPSLKDLATAAGEPWSELLLAHRDALVEVTDEIRRLSESNRIILSAAARATHETLLSINGTLETYAPTGRTTSAAPANLVDRSL
ncbi:FlgN protein [Quadrisphaera granulorum]|uniref:FlgN protein n=1 Tax=Quadrisphaera granulorum TaxID=317664 RepID=A0A316AFG9_9ACTN|nr:flagellar protein FlgN [Quadrisphaera granulorum]PWJ55644.1 FlgN protein [Quadrisphaera granulorum]SZE95141.1 FlgN protein [Quadrisphaera granulorum]